MAKLPSAPDLGGLPSLAAKQPIASYDLSSITHAGEVMGDTIARSGAQMGAAMGEAAATEAAATSRMGQGLEHFGTGTQHLAAGVAHYQFAVEDYELKTAQAEKLVQLAGLDQGLATDKDYKTMGDRYQKTVGSINQKIMATLSPFNQERYKQWSMVRDAHYFGTLAGHARGIEKDVNLARNAEQINKLQENGLTNPDPVRALDTIDQAAEVYKSQYNRGWISAQDLQNNVSKFRSDFSGRRVLMLPDEEQVRVLSGMPESGSFAANIPAFTRKEYLDRAEARLKTGQSDVVNAGIYRDGNQLMRGALESNDPKQVTSAIEQYNYMVDQSVAQDHTGHSDGEKQKAAFADAIAKRSVLLMPDEKQVAALEAVPEDGSVTSFIDPEMRKQMRNAAQQRLEQKVTREAAGQADVYQRNFIDAAAGKVTIVPRSALESDKMLDEPRRNHLLAEHDQAMRQINALEAVKAKFNDPKGGSFNPFDHEESKAVDTLYTQLGGDLPALQRVLNRTGYMPESAVRGIRGSLVSNDPERVVSALTVAANAIKAKPSAFEGSSNKADIEEQAVTFRHYVDDVGMSAKDAAAKIIEAGTPEYKARLKARIKGEDVDKIVRDGVAVSDIESEFKRVWPIIGTVPFTGAHAGAGQQMRQDMFTDFIEYVREKYMEGGDLALAKTQALEQLKHVWGETAVSGTRTVTRYPPEGAAGFAGVENASQLIGDQAVAHILEGTGKAVDRSRIQMLPIPGETAQAYKQRRPDVPYQLWWTDSNGVLQHTQKPFVPSPSGALAIQEENRRKAMGEARAVSDVVSRAPGMPAMGGGL